MAPPIAFPKTTTYPQNQVQFPSSEPQRRTMQAAPTTLAKHGRTTSFFSAFRLNRQQSTDGTHQRTVSLDNGATEFGSLGGSAPALASGAKNNHEKQTEPHQHPIPESQAPLPTPITMLQQQQSAAAGYQQPLPPTPAEPQHMHSGNNGPANPANILPTTQQAPPAQHAPLTNTPSQQAQPQPQQPAPLHPEVRSVVGLTVAHAHKIYFSGPLVRRIERQADGQRPHKEEGWTEVWAQLGGTTLSLWDMKEVQEASRQGKEVPPTYVNVTDAFIQVLGSVTVPATATSGPKRYTNVLTLNTAGSNLLLFSCPSTPALISWASALRLSAWEKSRLEEIYTAHLIRITLSNRDYPTTLIRGKLEGWAQIRVAGQTDWKRVWISINESSGLARVDSAQAPLPPPPVGSMAGKKKRMSSLFAREQSPPRSTLPVKASIFMYAGQKPKERKKALLTITDVSQAFAVYPERPELIPRSTLIKVEGTFGDEEMAMSMKSREGWILIMPLMEHLGPAANHSSEMLKWVVALHDAFNLYGRPQSWTWDPRDPVSLMFGYPVGPQKEHLFLDREVVENMDPRDDRTSVIRSRLREMLIDFIKTPGQPRIGQQDATSNGGPPSLPPIPSNDNTPQEQAPNGAAQQYHPHRLSTQNVGGPQLPPLTFGERPPEVNRPLTPITERDSVTTHNVAGYSGDNQQQSPKSSALSPSQIQSQLSQAPVQGGQSSSHLAAPEPEQNTMLGRDLSHSPIAMSPSGSSGGASILGSISGPPPPADTTLASPTRTSFGDKPIASQAGRSSFESNKTNGSIRSGSVSSPPRAVVPLSPNRRGGSINSTTLSTRSPTFPAKDKQPEQFDGVSRASHEDSLFNQHQASRSGIVQQPQPVPPQPAPAIPISSSASERNDDLVNEAGALFYMQQQIDSGSAVHTPPQQQPVNFDDDDSASASDVDIPKAAQKQPAKTQSSIASDNASQRSDSGSRRPVRQSTPMAFLDDTSFKNNGSPSLAANGDAYADSGARLAADRGYAPSRTALGRKPSGARAPQPTPKGGMAGYAPSSHSQQQLTSQYEDSEEEEEVGGSFNSQRKATLRQQQVPANKTQSPSMATTSVTNVPQEEQSNGNNLEFDDHNAEALAALAFLDVSDPPQQSISASNPVENNGPPIVTIEPLTASQDTTESNSGSSTFKSSFAPSKQAEERKKKAQAQQAALQAAVNKPGRANGKKRKGQVAGGWAESSEEEDEEEEEDDDEDVDSDGEPSQSAPPPRMQQQLQAAAIQAQQQQQQQFAPQSSVYPSVGGGHSGDPAYSHLRPPRTLPQPPNAVGSRPLLPEEYNSQPISRRQTSDQFTEGGRRTYHEDAPQAKGKPEGPAPGAARQTVWSQVLEAGRPGSNFHAPNESSQGRDTFVQLEPSETMTKAFTPQGLLSAGMQDKQDRSAKRQEELARETGASLINVPNKPPPPQTGLLGAITAHERERKREGGVGAALTEREREKRVAEERQRRFDEQQRQQLDQMQQGGSMYGSPYGFNPMMNPMMMGMNPMMGMSPMMTGGGVNPMMTGGQPNLTPMMTGGGMNPMMGGGGMNPMMGYGMMPGFNPQHLFAAQQAAQAYQNAMMAFSVAGSQVGGGDAGNGVGAAAMQQQQGMNPSMMNQANMGGFDPRMSMNLMGMGMMGGMGGMGPQMGNPQMMGQAPLGVQTTGTSQFDPRFGTPGMNGSPLDSGPTGPLPLNLGSNHNLSTPNSQFASGNNSPIGRGSSPLRHSETPPQRSRPTSPKA